jgi:membrane-associated phospholipid phosphatase
MFKQPIDDKSLPSATWLREIARRMVAHWPLKAVGTTLFLTLFFNAYFAVLHNPHQTPAMMPLTVVDQWIPLSVLAFPFYVSLWVYVSLAPAFIANRRTLLVFGLWMGALCITGLLLFWLFPTTIPPTGIDWSHYPQIQFLKGIDSTGNACPSLHVATAVFSALWLFRLLRVAGAPCWLLSLSTLHCLLIVWSTLSTRQHVFVDVVAGALAGLMFGLLSLIHAARTSTNNDW